MEEDVKNYLGTSCKAKVEPPHATQIGLDPTSDLHCNTSFRLSLNLCLKRRKLKRIGS